ncbi:MAG: heme ABC transporter ATP-binding protein [Pseudomonadota bacterium]
MTLRLERASVIRAGTAILNDATLACQAGRFTALCGPNGAGKTTALSLLSGALRTDRGSVSLDGRAIASFNSLDLARRRAVVAQNSPLSFPFHVHEVVEMGRTPWTGVTGKRRDSEIVADAMAAMEVGELGARNYLTLSGGERQRVNIARALAQVWDQNEQGDTRWLLLDEPTSALDLKHQIALLALLSKLARNGWGVVAVLHDLHLVHKHADQVILFRGGEIFADGTPNEVLEPSRIQAAYGLDTPYVLAH